MTEMCDPCPRTTLTLVPGLKRSKPGHPSFRGYPRSRFAISSEQVMSWVPRSRLCVAVFALRSKHGHEKP